MTRYWKVLNAAGHACHGGTFDYTPYLPRERKDGTYAPGPWLPLIRNVVPCGSGYHLCRDADLVHWLHDRIWAVEVRGRVVAEQNKVVCGQFRFTSPTPWDAVSARVFAVECAADVAHLMQDGRSYAAMEVAYRFALGDATGEERAAAWATARARQTARLLYWVGATTHYPEAK